MTKDDKLKLLREENAKLVEEVHCLKEKCKNLEDENEKIKIKYNDDKDLRKKEMDKIRKKKYYEKNKEKFLQKAKEYKDKLKIENPDKIKEHNHKQYLKRKQQKEITK